MHNARLIQSCRGFEGGWGRGSKCEHRPKSHCIWVLLFNITHGTQPVRVRGSGGDKCGNLDTLVATGALLRIRTDPIRVWRTGRSACEWGCTRSFYRFFHWPPHPESIEKNSFGSPGRKNCCLGVMSVTKP